MKAVCFEGVERVGLRDLPRPRCESPTDAIVRVAVAGLCGSDLHPYWGRESGLDPGTVMGHEMVGEIAEVGAAVTRLAVGDRVMGPFSTNCGKCFYCAHELPSRCERGQLFGWVQQGVGLQGCQSEFVRTPLAESTLMKIPAGVSERAALLLGDNLSTGFFAAEMADVRAEGSYAVIGCGTVGLLAVLAARTRGAAEVFALDPIQTRRERAERLGAIGLEPGPAAIAQIRNRTGGRGVDAVMELVGLPDAQRLAWDIVRPGGTLASIGCHTTAQFSFSPVEAYDKNLTYRTGRCPARRLMPDLAERIACGELQVDGLITHEFAPEDCERAYRIFARRQDGCQKAMFRFGPDSTRG